jgi:hypothetical protein
VSLADEAIWREIGLAEPPHVVVQATGYTVERKAVYFQEIYIPKNRGGSCSSRITGRMVSAPSRAVDAGGSARRDLP